MMAHSLRPGIPGSRTLVSLPRLVVVLRSILQRRLVDVSERLKRARADLAVSEEQSAFFEDEAEDARLRALMAETPIADVEARDARRDADAQARHRDDLRRTVAELVHQQDHLLDGISAELAGDVTTPTG